MTQQIRVYAADHDGNASSETFTDMADAYKRFDEERGKPRANAVSIEVLKPLAGDVIRLWKDRQGTGEHVVAPFNRGFSIPVDHPAAKVLSVFLRIAFVGNEQWLRMQSWDMRGSGKLTAHFSRQYPARRWNRTDGFYVENRVEPSPPVPFDEHHPHYEGSAQQESARREATS